MGVALVDKMWVEVRWIHIPAESLQEVRSLYVIFFKSGSLHEENVEQSHSWSIKKKKKYNVNLK